jgi:type II secretory pathway pseudopilin PulG
MFSYVRLERGLSIVEILVVLGLLAIVSLLLATLFGHSLRVTARESALLELEQTSYFTLEKIEADLLESNLTGISLLEGGPGEITGVAVNPIHDITSDGDLAWKGSSIIYFYLPDKESVYKLKYPSGIEQEAEVQATSTRFTKTELLDLVQANKGRALRVTDGVKSFAIAPDDSTSGSRLLSLSITLERNIGETEERTFTLRKDVALRN